MCDDWRKHRLAQTTIGADILAQTTTYIFQEQTLPTFNNSVLRCAALTGNRKKKRDASTCRYIFVIIISN